MARKLCIALLLALALTLIAVPVLAAYYAYIYVEESSGNSYDSLPLSASANITRLIQGDFMSSTGLDTRVLTGSGEVLPHMVADDKVMFVTDLEAYEDKTLIFYLGATSLSNFYIIPGYDGYITTEDDADLEYLYVMELLASGYFDASAGADKNILYKEDAYRVYISDDDEITVAGLSAGDVEEWVMDYDSFTSGEHTVYIVSNGLGAYLYVDTFDVAKDTHNLYEGNSAVIHNSAQSCLPWWRQTFYAQDKYWAFYNKNDGNIYWRTSADGTSWAAEQSAAGNAGDTSISNVCVCLRNDYVHITYADDALDAVRYRRGEPEADNTITWSAAWQTVVTGLSGNAMNSAVAVDNSNYPQIVYQRMTAGYDYYTYLTKSSANDGTWTTAGGYPLELMAGFSYISGATITEFTGTSDKLYTVYRYSNALRGRYYNGTSWAGSYETIASGYSVSEASCVADADDNVYIVWHDTTNSIIYFRIRYSDGSFSDTVELVDGVPYPSGCSVSYNDESDYIYITYGRDDSVRAMTLGAGTLTGEYTVFTPEDIDGMCATAYGSHIGLLYEDGDNTETEHGFLQFPWTWNDNANNWTWMEGNCMPYADYFTMAIDGVTQLNYEPADIIEGTTLPDEESSHDGIITWGSNPAGVDVSMSELQFEQSYNETYYYQYIEPGSQDIISPEPGAITGDVDLERLENNPLNLLVQTLVSVRSDGWVTARLAWLGIAWFILIAAMIATQLLTHHMMLTGIVGFGLSTLFYTMGIFPLWVVILFGMGMVASIIYERMTVL